MKVRASTGMSYGALGKTNWMMDVMECNVRGENVYLPRILNLYNRDSLHDYLRIDGRASLLKIDGDYGSENAGVMYA